MKKTKAQKGITLIALIITIIVLLILAVVAIRAVQGDGIITKAKEARTSYERAQAEEEVKLVLDEWSIVEATKADADLETFLNSKFEDIVKNADGTFTVTVNGYEIGITEKGNISSVEEPIPEISVSDIKVVESSDGTGTALTEKSVSDATKQLYISFTAGIEGGTITVKQGEATVSKTGELYVYPVTTGENKSYEFTITASDNTTKTFTVTVNQYDIGPKVGDFVTYDAGNWTSDQIAAIKTGVKGSEVTANGSATLPTTAYQFGGFAVGTSRNSSATPQNSNYSYIQETVNGTTQAVTGWRIFDITENGGTTTYTLISAGCPEDYYQNNGYVSQYILTGVENNYAKNSTHTARDWSIYVDSTQKAVSARTLTYAELQSWYEKYTDVGANAKLAGSATFKKANPYDLIDNYSYFWLATADTTDAEELLFVNPVAGSMMWGISGYANGLRILISLSSEASLTKSEKVKTITSRGSDYTYNVWNIE